jgi:hypothetical protein
MVDNELILPSLLKSQSVPQESRHKSAVLEEPHQEQVADN